jgi:hypothetical protein
MASAPEVLQPWRLIVRARLWKFPLVPPGAPTPTWQTSSRERRTVGEKCLVNSAVKQRVPRYLKGSFTFCKSATWDLMALLPLRRKACCGFFSPWKIWRLRPGSNPWTWVPEASMLTPRPMQPLSSTLTADLQEVLFCIYHNWYMSCVYVSWMASWHAGIGIRLNETDSKRCILFVLIIQMGHSMSSEPYFQHSDPRMKLSICEVKIMNSFGDFSKF